MGESFKHILIAIALRLNHFNIQFSIITNIDSKKIDKNLTQMLLCFYAYMFIYLNTYRQCCLFIIK